MFLFHGVVYTEIIILTGLQVRDIYDGGDYLVLVTTDRQSAFDRILASIPFKGQVHHFMLLAFFNLMCRKKHEDSFLL